jgi:hypothetical protein
VTEPFYRSSDYRGDQRARSWDADSGGVPQARPQSCIVLQVQSQIWWHALHGRVSRSDVPRVNVSDTHRLKSLEDENGKLKRLLADTMLENVVLKDLLGKN